MDTVVTKTDSMKITGCYATAHAELAAGHWLMCQGSGRGSMGLSKFGCWTFDDAGCCAVMMVLRH